MVPLLSKSNTVCNPGFGKVPSIVCERSQSVSASAPLRTGIVGHSVCCFPAEKLCGVVGKPGVFLYSIDSEGGLDVSPLLSLRGKGIYSLV